MMQRVLTLLLLGILPGYIYAEPLAIHEFHDKGKTVGHLYAEFTENNLLESAQIKLDGKVLYTIDKKGFRDSEKLQAGCACNPFYGFIINELTATRISVTMADEKGREVSDGATILWDKENEKFTILLLP